MNAPRKILGYGWALLATPMVLALFFGYGTWPKLLAGATGLRVSAWMNGGEVARTIPHEGYETRIHRPVFDGLLGPRAKGFVQIDWVASAPARGLPDKIKEEIDYDNNGLADFAVDLDVKSNRAVCRPLQTNVLGAERVMTLSQGRVLRIGLERH